MNVPVFADEQRKNNVVLWGALLGFGGALVYGMLYALYVTLRSSFQIVRVLPVREGLPATLAANAVATFVSAFSIALVFSIPAFIIMGLTTLLIERLSPVYNPRHTSTGAISLGGTISALLAAALSVIARRMTVAYPDFFPGGYFTWVGIPCIILIVLGIWVSWTINQMESHHE